MLSDREKAEMLEMAASAEIRAAAERLRSALKPRSLDEVRLDQYLDWLTSMADFGPRMPETPHSSFSRALL